MTIGFTADFEGGVCPECKNTINKGDRITYTNLDSRRLPVHVDCQMAEEDSGERFVEWLTPIDDRIALLELEYAQAAPLQRPVCPTCWLELPKSLVCGVC